MTQAKPTYSPVEVIISPSYKDKNGKQYYGRAEVIASNINEKSFTRDSLTGEFTVPVKFKIVEIVFDDFTDRDDMRDRCSRRIADAHFIGEAFNVYHETKLTPRQLLGQRDELLATIQELLSFELADQIEGDIDGAYLHQSKELKAAIDNVKEAIAKIEGKHD